MARKPILTPALPTGGDRDPLSRYRDGAVVAGTRQPIPLVATQIRVRLEGGLAVVRTERLFRNTEPAPIEATITFPVPVQATLFGLAACIGNRLLRATARRRNQARAAYEDAMDCGKAAVLHEEVLRGVHMLSVGQVPPGAEILVASDWVMPLSLVGDGTAALRIPITVGEIYGRSPLADSDDLVTDPTVVHEAELEVICLEGEVSLVGGPALAGGRARLRLDRPIDLRVSDWVPRDLSGLAADGRGVTLRVTPAPTQDAPIDAVVLVDRSGSMGSPADGGSPGAPTKHAAVVEGLRAAAGALCLGDRVCLWEFDDTANPVRSRRGGDLHDAIAALQPPRGGTETGAAIAAVLAAEPAGDVVLITDGQTHALDLQAAARSGRRFTVVLIGEDSLEAHVGTLAALTGGQVFIAGADVAPAVRLAVATLRSPHQILPPADDRPVTAEALVGGMRVTATLGTQRAAPPPEAEDVLARAIGALAASLALPRLPGEAAAALAEAEGLCCHLTGLVLVDEKGEVQEGIPAQRKVPIMAPRLPVMAYAAPPVPAGGMQIMSFRHEVGSGLKWRMSLTPPPLEDASALDIPTFLRRQTAPDGAAKRSGKKAPDTGLALWLGHVDWSRNPEALRRGGLDGLPPGLVRALEQAAVAPDIVALARALQLSAVILVLALLARSEATGNRFAARFARAVLGGADRDRVAEAARCLGL
jgi:hypothetical protein